MFYNRPCSLYKKGLCRDPTLPPSGRLSPHATGTFLTEVGIDALPAVVGLGLRGLACAFTGRLRGAADIRIARMCWVLRAPRPAGGVMIKAGLRILELEYALRFLAILFFHPTLGSLCSVSVDEATRCAPR